MAERRLRGHGLAEDVVQETLWRAYRALPELDPGRPVWPWLKKVAENVCRDVLRARLARPEHLVADSVEQGAARDLLGAASGEADLGGEVVARQRAQCIVDALNTVNPRQREVLIQMAEGTSAEEVALAQGTTVNAIKSAVKRGRQQFRTAYISMASERGLLGVTVAPVDTMRSLMERARRLVGGAADTGSALGALQVLPAALGMVALAVSALFGGGNAAAGDGFLGLAPPHRTVVAEVASIVGAAAGRAGAPVVEIGLHLGGGPGERRAVAGVDVAAPAPGWDDWGGRKLQDGLGDIRIEVRVGIDHSQPSHPGGFDIYETGVSQDHTYSHGDMSCDASERAKTKCDLIDKYAPKPIIVEIPVPPAAQKKLPG